MPLCVMGGVDTVSQVGHLVGYLDEASLRKIYRRLYEGKHEKDIGKGKAPVQVA